MYVGMNGWVNEAAPSQVNNDTRGLKLDGAGSDEKQAFLWFKLPFRPGEDVDVTEATLIFNLKTAWPGSHVLSVRRITETWSARTLTWANQPATATPTVPSEVTISDGAIGDEYEVDVTLRLSAVASGAAEFYGFRLEIGNDGPYSILSRDAYNPANRPRLHVVWTEKPDKPTDLSPAGGNVISKAQPNLGWHNPGFRGETTQARARVQVASNADMSILTFDTADVAGADGNGFIPLTETEIDLEDAAYAVPAIADGDNRWWRVKYEDDSGRRSDYSNIQKFTRQAKGTLTILNPVDGATLEDLTPTVLLGFTGATLAGRALYLDKVNEDGDWEEIWRNPHRSTTDLSIPVPKGYIRRTTDRYRFRARAWDDEEREARPGDPMWVQDIAEFTWDRNAIVDPVDSISVAQHADGSPLVDVTFTDDDAPDYYCLVVDGDRKRPRYDPEDVVTGVGTYRIVYPDAVPFANTIYEVERVLLVSGEYKHSGTPVTVTFRSTPYGIWLFDPDDPNIDVVLEGPDHGADFEWGEVAQTFYPAGGTPPQAPVRLLQSTRGREGTVSGALRHRGSVQARTYLSRLRKIWRQGRTMRLVMGEVNVPVVIGEPRDSPLNEPDPAYQVSFTAFQVDDFER